MALDTFVCLPICIQSPSVRSKLSSVQGICVVYVLDILTVGSVFLYMYLLDIHTLYTYVYAYEYKKILKVAIENNVKFFPSI